MKVTILYRPNSEFARSVEEFSHDIARQQNITPELVSIDTREGAAMASIYDITSYPAIMALRDDGGMAQLWMGERLPLMNEVAAFAHS